MTTPLVSVLVPARDAAATLHSALASVRAQTLAEHEVVLVDDGSRDGTAELVTKLARADDRIRLERVPGLGIVGALNHGLARCRAPLVARFDADDLMHRDRLQLQVAALVADPTLDGVGSLVRCFPRPTLRDGMRRYERWLNEVVTVDEIHRERFVEAPLVHPSVTLRRSALEAVGGWQDTPWPEDWDLWLRLAGAGFRLGKIPKTLHFWRDGATRLTRTDARYGLAKMALLRAHHLARGPLAGRPAVVWGAGPTGKELVRALDAEGVRVVAYVDVDPRKIGQRVHGRPVLAESALPVEPGAVLLAAVGAAGGRADIRAAALARGYVEGVDFFACA